MSRLYSNEIQSLLSTLTVLPGRVYLRALLTAFDWPGRRGEAKNLEIDLRLPLGVGRFLVAPAAGRLRMAAAGTNEP